MLLGLDRAPEVKTLRRKLWELAARRQATHFSQRLAERWVHDQYDPRQWDMVLTAMGICGTVFAPTLLPF